MRIDSLHYHTAETRRVSAELSEKTSTLLTWAHKFLKTAGWERIAERRLSAMFEKVYRRGQREVCFSGWHGTGAKGTGRNYGDLKLIFSISDNHPGEKGPRELYAKEQLSLDIVNGTVQDAEQFMLLFKGYIQALK